MFFSALTVLMLLVPSTSGALMLKRQVAANILAETGAKCMDGSSPVYYFAPNSRSDVWLINLRGGGWCSSRESCAKRPLDMRSTNGAPDSVQGDGFFSDDAVANPVFHDANRIDVYYCSSDGWMGTRDFYFDNTQYFAHGHLVVQAVIRDALTFITDRNKNYTFFFAGASAGGRGALVNLPWVESHITSNLKSAKVVGLLDSALWLDISDTSSLQQSTMGAYDTFIDDSTLDQDCIVKYANDKWRCAFGQYALPYLKDHHVLIVDSLYDAFHINSIHYEDRKDDFLVQMRQFLLGSWRSAWNPEKYLGIVSWSCYNHAMSATGDGLKLRTANGGSIARASSAVLAVLSLPAESIDATAPTTPWRDIWVETDCSTDCTCYINKAPTECIANWHGASCEERTTCLSGSCNTKPCAGLDGTGDCNSCVKTTVFGSACASPVSCNTEHGECPLGKCNGIQGNGQCTSCNRPWSGPNCQVDCKDPQSEATCEVCPPGRHGPHCQGVVSCSSENGECLLGSCHGPTGNGQCTSCNGDWSGNDCTTPCTSPNGATCTSCPTNKFGPHCEHDIGCTDNGSCGPDCHGVEGTGKCTFCQPGWQGDYCDIPSNTQIYQAENNAWRVVVMVACGIGMLSSGVLFWYFHKRDLERSMDAKVVDEKLQV